MGVKRGTKMRPSGLSPKTGSCSGETGKLTSEYTSSWVGGTSLTFQWAVYLNIGATGLN